MGSKIRSFSQHTSVLGVGVNETFSGSILQFKAGSIFLLTFHMKKQILKEEIQKSYFWRFAVNFVFLAANRQKLLILIFFFGICLLIQFVNRKTLPALN